MVLYRFMTSTDPLKTVWLAEPATKGPVATFTTGPVATFTTGPVATFTTGPVATFTTGPVATFTTGPVATFTKGATFRKVTERSSWQFAVPHSDQLAVLSNITDPLYNQVQQQINYKIQGYKGQDTKKGRTNDIEFVTYNDVVDLLTRSQLICYYCTKPVNLLYDNSRDPSQWTLERIDNEYGHLRENVVVACLGCNLRRRIMYSKNYLKTKAITQEKIIKLGREP
jgi:hypothetical protein